VCPTCVYDRAVHAVVNRIRLREPLDDVALRAAQRALERTRVQLGNTFMREHVIPHADGPPERTITKVVLSYRRASGA
jgi:hypothetical protein